MNKQAKERLRAEKANGKMGHCCLGVLTDLAVKEGVISEFVGNAEDRVQGQDGDVILCNKVRRWAGLRSVEGNFTESKFVMTSLVELNDAGKTLKYIAKVIESEPKGLFTTPRKNKPKA